MKNLLIIALAYLCSAWTIASPAGSLPRRATGTSLLPDRQFVDVGYRSLTVGR